MFDATPLGKEAATAIEVEILTKDHEIRGLVYGSRDVDETRRISDLLNGSERKFLAVTDATILNRNNPCTPRQYSFLELHIDSIMMIHPASEIKMSGQDYNQNQGQRFEQFRDKLASSDTTPA